MILVFIGTLMLEWSLVGTGRVMMLFTFSSIFLLDFSPLLLVFCLRSFFFFRQTNEPKLSSFLFRVTVTGGRGHAEDGQD